MRNNPEEVELDPAVDDRDHYKKNSSVLPCIDIGIGWLVRTVLFRSTIFIKVCIVYQRND